MPAGLVGEALAAAGCKEKKGLAAANVLYDSSGRSQVVKWFERPRNPACGEAVEAIFACALAAPDEVPDTEVPQTVAMLFDRAYLACVDAQTAAAPFEPSPETCAEGGEAAGIVTAPEIVKQVPPKFDERAKAARIQGLVVLEAIIATSGCPQDLRVYRAPVYELARSSIEATSRWRFKPGALDGKPVKVHFTLTVNYTLR